MAENVVEKWTWEKMDWKNWAETNRGRECGTEYYG